MGKSSLTASQPIAIVVMKGLRRGFDVDVHRRSCFNPLPDAPTGDINVKPFSDRLPLIVSYERLLAESEFYGALLRGPGQT